MNTKASASHDLSIFERPLWLSQSLAPKSPHLNVAFVFWFDKGLDAGRFQVAWDTVTDTQLILRSRLTQCDGHPQRTESAPPPEMTTLDFRNEANPKAASRNWCKRRAGTPLPISDFMVESALLRFSNQGYAWFVNCHHLITDAITSRLIYELVAEQYCVGESTCALQRQHGDYGEVARQLTRASAGGKSSGYWDKQLGTAPRRSSPYARALLPSTTDSRRFTVALSNAQSQSLLDLVERDELRSISKDLSLFIAFCTVLSAWLSRVSDGDIAHFDAPVRNRPSRGSRRTLGAFIEFFPFSVELQPHDSFLTLASRCKQAALQQVRHAVPGASPLTAATASNVVLNFVPDEFESFDGLVPRVEWIHSGHTDLAHSVRLQVERFWKQDSHRIHLDLNAEIFPGLVGERAFGHFSRLLEAMLADPSRAVAEVDILDGDERRTLLDTFNQLSAARLPTMTVVDRWRGHCDHVPDAVAVRDTQRSLNYRELRERVDALATRLVAHGVGVGHNVLVLLPRSIESVVAILAILSVRAAYVPGDPNDPIERVADIAKDCEPVLALVMPAGESRAADFGLASLAVDLDAQPLETAAAPPDASRLDDRAYIIYTSGSTGTPKGIPIDHVGLADYVDWADRTYVRGRRWTFPLFSSLSFDLTVTSLFLPLVTGGTLVVYQAPAGPVDSSLMDVLGENAVDFLKLTPSHLALARRHALSRSRIRCLVVGGEDFDAKLANEVANSLAAGAEIYNEYGPTEAVVGCMLHRYDPDTDTRASVPIGRPAGNTRLYVLNQAGQPVPEGVTGELYIARHGMTTGYLNRPALNETQFRRSPFRKGERLYRSGDLVRFTRPDALEYSGRADRQLKVAGIRIEAGEIETAILAFPGISHCIVATAGTTSAQDAWREPAQRCSACGLPDNFPGAQFDDDGICTICQKFERVRERANGYFGSPDALRALVAEAAERRSGPYDCMMLYSGGKDSTFALCRLVDLGFNVYAYTLDNGYLSSSAKDNIVSVSQSLGIAHEFASTPHMREIFRDSLERFSNVCNGCFKTIYTLSMLRARELGIKAIVTGLSRGQFFETRLSEAIFRDGDTRSTDIDAAVLAARKAYHRFNDAVSRTIDVRVLQNDEIFEEVSFIDFYRYWPVSLEEIYSYLTDRTPWVRPQDTGRSTNCLINDVGIYVHKKERGYHNYALPYSWDVRLGHKTRPDAVQELDDAIDTSRVTSILAEIGYESPSAPVATRTTNLVAWYVADQAVDNAALRRHLTGRLTPAIIPGTFIQIDQIPLTSNGKVAIGELTRSAAARVVETQPMEPPNGDTEEAVARIWREVLGVDRLSATQRFFDVGGTSLTGMDVMLRLGETFDIELPLRTIFVHTTIRSLAGEIERAVLASVEAMSDEAAAAQLDDRSAPP